MSNVGLNVFNETILQRFNPDRVVIWSRPCRPRILLLTDGSLNYNEADGFGLWRFIHSLTVATGVINKPTLTLAHRGVHSNNVIVGNDNYTVISGFRFDDAAVPVTLANYDQIWIFGFDSRPFALNAAELSIIVEFMNSGGGVFATGDHSSLGRSLCGSLPRVRHMREWREASAGGVPMGTESDASLAVNRIDTVVSPGVNRLYEFADQSDNIPQRIYPNYRVTDIDGNSGSAWRAAIHPLLMLPNSAAQRTDSSGFLNDMDVLPDHPHESQCYDVTEPAKLTGVYNILGQNFPEFQSNSANNAQRVGAEIVAYAVSGGRSVLNGSWKPPVRPRMFGVISAYDGRQAQPYPGKTQRPGRIVCDSTWHHFVNINLDGRGSTFYGLGTGRGNQFIPSPDLEKIYVYYRNIVMWLQPANRILCYLWWDLVALRFSKVLFEELLEIDRLVGWRDMVGLGREAQLIMQQVRGIRAVNEQINGLLGSDARTRVVIDLINSDEIASSSLDASQLIDGIYGSLLLGIAQLLPPNIDDAAAERVLGDGPSRHVNFLLDRVNQAVRLGVQHQRRNLEAGLAGAARLAALV